MPAPQSSLAVVEEVSKPSFLLTSTGAGLGRRITPARSPAPPPPVYPGAVEAQGLGASRGFSHASSCSLLCSRCWAGHRMQNVKPLPAPSTQPHRADSHDSKASASQDWPRLIPESSKALPQEFWSGPASVMSQRCLSWYLGKRDVHQLRAESTLKSSETQKSKSTRVGVRKQAGTRTQLLVPS